MTDQVPAIGSPRGAGGVTVACMPSQDKSPQPARLRISWSLPSRWTAFFLKLAGLGSHTPRHGRGAEPGRVLDSYDCASRDAMRALSTDVR